MKFNVYDKYILDVLNNKIKDSEKAIKDSIKKEYLDINKILDESKTVGEEEAASLIKSGKSFVAGVNFFDNKKTDFYLLSNDGLTIPITPRSKLIIKDEIELEKELRAKGYINTMSIGLKSKDDIYKNPNSYNSYKIKRDMPIDELQKRLENFGGVKTKVVPNTYYKLRYINQSNMDIILSKVNKLTITLYEKLHRTIPHIDGILEDLNYNGFKTLKKLTTYKDSIKEITNQLKNIESLDLLYTKIDSERLELKESIPYDLNLNINRDLLKVEFDESKIKSIIRNDFLENVEFEKDTEIRIGKPIKTLEEYNTFLRSEEYIRKITSTTKIELDIDNIPTLEQIYEKEFQMKI